MPHQQLIPIGLKHVSKDEDLRVDIPTYLVPQPNPIRIRAPQAALLQAASCIKIQELLASAPAITPWQPGYCGETCNNVLLSVSPDAGLNYKRLFKRGGCGEFGGENRGRIEGKEEKEQSKKGACPLR